MKSPSCVCKERRHKDGAPWLRSRYNVLIIYSHPPKIFPDGAVFFQVDQNPDFAALSIGDELYSGHGFRVRQMILER